MSAPFPWQVPAWEMLCQAHRAGRLGHAWLLYGRNGMGKQQFARRFAGWLLCEAAGADSFAACGNCRSCVLEQAGSHPDLRWVAPLDDAKSIGIDQIRELNDYAVLASHYGRAKLVILAPADVMTRGAANALLKLLEEPPPQVVFVLLANRLEGLPLTIRSRCQQLKMERGPSAVRLAWLQQQRPEVAPAFIAASLSASKGAPLAALMVLDSGFVARLESVYGDMLAVASGRVHAIQAAQKTADIAVDDLADTMMSVVRSAMCGAVDNPLDTPAGLSLQRAINELNSKPITEFMSRAESVKALALGGANPRPNDLVDQLWLGWMRCTRQGRTPRRDARKG